MSESMSSVSESVTSVSGPLMTLNVRLQPNPNKKWPRTRSVRGHFLRNDSYKPLARAKVMRFWFNLTIFANKPVRFSGQNHEILHQLQPEVEPHPSQT